MLLPACLAAALFLLAVSSVLVVAVADQPRSLTVGPLRVSFLTPAVARFEFVAFEDAPSITFPLRLSQPVPAYKIRLHTADALVVETDDLVIRFSLVPSDSLSTRALIDCAHLNVTILATGVVACIGEATGKVPTDPAFPGTVMDEWTDIIRGPPGNLGGSLDSTDCTRVGWDRNTLDGMG